MTANVHNIRRGRGQKPPPPPEAPPPAPPASQVNVCGQLLAARAQALVAAGFNPIDVVAGLLGAAMAAGVFLPPLARAHVGKLLRITADQLDPQDEGRR